MSRRIERCIDCGKEVKPYHGTLRCRKCAENKRDGVVDYVDPPNPNQVITFNFSELVTRIERGCMGEIS